MCINTYVHFCTSHLVYARILVLALKCVCFSAFLHVEACFLLLECGCDLCACNFLCIVPCIVVCECTFMSCMMGHA